MSSYKNVLFIAAFVACLIMGIVCGQDDYLEGGYVSSGGTNLDEGLSGMLQWLNQPVPNLPWYTTGGSFYNQPHSDSAFSTFKQYYMTSGMPVSGGIISNPAKFDITKKTPSSVYYGVGVGLPYSQYAAMSTRTNDLWIRGPTNWTQYVVSPVGAWLQLIANTPVGGSAGFYEVIQTDTTNSKYKTYQFNQGYNTMDFYADQVGRHMLYYVVNNQPSNVVIVDVLYEVAPSVVTVPKSTEISSPPSYTTPPVPTPISGDVPVTINYPDSRSFDVYVDGNYIGTGSGGSFSFSAPSGMHDIRVWDGIFPYENGILLGKGIPKIINVEAV